MAETLKAKLAAASWPDGARTVVRLVSEGEPLKNALQAAGMRQQDFHVTLGRERELAVAYVRAQEMRADLLADEVLSIADNAEIDPQRARNMIDARRWRTKTLNPKVYGERIDLNVTQTVDILGTLQEARARIARPIYDQQPEMIDVTPVESMSCERGASDKESVTADPPPIPDIFS